jgi:cysteine desulfurase
MYAPKGVGALYVRRGTPIRPLLHGAGHERGLRPGTENVASLVGFGQAARLANHSTDENSAHLAERRDRLYARLCEGIGAELTFNGHPEERLPNTLSVNFPRVSGQQLLERAANVYASTGAACHSGGSSMSATLAAIQLAPEAARGTVRLSLGWTTSVEEVDRASDSLLSAWESLLS